jgi:hypothetical protein
MSGDFAEPSDGLEPWTPRGGTHRSTIAV